MGKTKKDTNASGWAKKTNKRMRGGATVHEWYQFNVSRWVRYSNSSEESLLTSLLYLSSSQIFQNLSLLLTRFFLSAWYDSCSRQDQLSLLRSSWCIFIPSSLFSPFPTGPRSFPLSMFTYNLRELHLIQKYLVIRLKKTLINWVVNSVREFPRKSSRFILYTS